MTERLAIPPFFFSEAVRHYWDTRERQGINAQAGAGEGRNVRGGRHLDGFLASIVTLMIDRGVSPDDVFTNCELHRTGRLDLPGYYRPTKEWDLLVVRDGHLITAVELKAQAGPSFGNNFNNRTEEAMGSALDIWTAYREGAFSASPQPWLGYLILLEDCPQSMAPVQARESHFRVFPEFQGASYARRYEIFCRKLVLERQYNAACFLMSNRERRNEAVNYLEPAEDLGSQRFLLDLLKHVVPA